MRGGCTGAFPEPSGARYVRCTARNRPCASQTPASIGRAASDDFEKPAGFHDEGIPFAFARFLCLETADAEEDVSERRQSGAVRRGLRHSASGLDTFDLGLSATFYILSQCWGKKEVRLYACRSDRGPRVHLALDVVGQETGQRRNFSAAFSEAVPALGCGAVGCIALALALHTA